MAQSAAPMHAASVDITPRPSFWNVENWLIFQAFDHAARARRAVELTKLSDAQLAEIGLKREEIVQHVFEGAVR